MTTALPPGLPVPRPARDGVDTAFWEALSRDQLVVQRCPSCGRRRWPPEWICAGCRSGDLQWEEVSPRGRIYTWTRVWHPTHAALQDACPYIAVVVELDDDPSIRMLGNLVGDPLEEVTIGAAVEGVFEHGDGVTMLQWRRREQEPA